ncbi:TPA: hypothetical protein EYG96_01060 [Candidatus Gracilibacteria bacterium]|nr:hypothetical protein [Candidatus Gracilibacteria bacterium]HIQ57727.1 hypothetical protein [Candidatus Gracilibacteria bacterium]
MKLLLNSFAYIKYLLVLVLFMSSIAFAAGGHLPSEYKDVVNNLKEIQKPIAGNGAVDMTKKLIEEKIIPLAKFLFIGVGLIFMGMYAYKIVLGTGEDDQLDMQKENILYAAIGFALVALAEPMTQIFDPIDAKDVTQLIQEEALESVIMIIVNSVEVLLGTILVILIFYAGMQMVTADGDDETMKKAKDTFKFSFIGILIIMIAKPLITKVFYPEKGAIDPGTSQVQEFLKEAFGVLEYLLQFLGILVFVAFVYASVLYLISGTDEEKRTQAKDILIWAAIGMVIVLFSYSIVMFFVGT